MDNGKRADGPAGRFVMTERLYRDDVYKRSCSAVVTGVRETERGTALEFDRTVFCPEGGGQGCDVGAAVRGDGLCLDVVDVQEEGGALLHFVRAAGAGECTKDTEDPENPESGERTKADRETENSNLPGIAAGDRVEMSIDWDVRVDHMQKHAGEHILSGAFHRLFGAFNQGFHMGEDFITIDLAFRPEGEVTRMTDLSRFPEYSRVTWEMARQAEQEANRVIREDAPISVRYFQTRGEAEAMPLRKALNFDEDISVVTVGDPDRPYDCCPCCGTHPDSAGQVGMIKIYRLEQNRGKTRVYFEAGRRAFENYERQYDLLTALGERLSAGEQDLMEKLVSLQEKEDELHNEVYQLRLARVDEAAEEIRGAMRPGLVRRYDDLTVDELLRVQKKLRKSISGVIFLVQTRERVVLLLSDGEGPKGDCAGIVRDIARPLGGKGGGKPTGARVMFDRPEALESFLKQAQAFLN